MTTVTPSSLYFSGQGILWAGRLKPDGSVMGYRALGNVSSLILAPTDRRSAQKRLTHSINQFNRERSLEVGGSLTANLESLHHDNLAMMSGDFTTTAIAHAAQFYLPAGYIGAYAYLPHTAITGVNSITTSSYALTAYTSASAAYDYRIDTAGGLLYINDGAAADVVGLKNIGISVTAYSNVSGFLRLTTAAVIAVGNCGLLVNHNAVTDAPAQKFRVRAVGSGYLDTDIPVTGAPAYSGGAGTKVIPDGFSITLNYSYGEQVLSQILPAPLKRFGFLFQGLNGVDGGLYNIRVPCAYLPHGLARDLINEDVSSVQLAAKMLLNPRSAAFGAFTIETTQQAFQPVTYTG